MKDKLNRLGELMKCKFTDKITVAEALLSCVMWTFVWTVMLLMATSHI